METVCDTNLLNNYLKNPSLFQQNTKVRLNCKNRQGYNTLAYAIVHNKELSVVRELLSYVNTLDDNARRTFLTQEFRGENYLMLACAYYPASLPVLFNEMRGKDKATFKALLLAKDQKGKFKLLNHLRFIGHILPVLSNLGEDEVCKTIFSHINARGENALTLAARHDSETLQRMIDMIKGFDDRALFETLFTQPNNQGLNALMVAAYYNPNAVEPLLSGMELLDKSTIKTILTQVSELGSNALMLALAQHSFKSYSHHAAVSIFNAMAILDNHSMTKILSQTNKKGPNALMLALYYHHEMVQPIMTMIRTLDTKVAAMVLKQKTKEGYNALMLSLSYCPEKIDSILSAIAELDKADILHVLMNIMKDYGPRYDDYDEYRVRELDECVIPLHTHSSNYHLNTYMLAVKNHPKALIPLFTFLSNMDLKTKGEILTHRSYQNKNILTYAIEHRPTFIKALFEEINKLPPLQQTNIIIPNRKQLNRFKSYLSKEAKALLSIHDKLIKYQPTSLFCARFTSVTNELALNFKDKMLKVMSCSGTLDPQPYEPILSKKRNTLSKLYRRLRPFMNDHLSSSLRVSSSATTMMRTLSVDDSAKKACDLTVGKHASNGDSSTLPSLRRRIAINTSGNDTYTKGMVEDDLPLLNVAP